VCRLDFSKKKKKNAKETTTYFKVGDVVSVGEEIGTDFLELEPSDFEVLDGLGGEGEVAVELVTGEGGQVP
jgi:hypothetical protein